MKCKTSSNDIENLHVFISTLQDLRKSQKYNQSLYSSFTNSKIVSFI